MDSDKVLVDVFITTAPEGEDKNKYPLWRTGVEMLASDFKKMKPISQDSNIKISDKGNWVVERNSIKK
jgi:hypothetical protein